MTDPHRRLAQRPRALRLGRRDHDVRGDDMRGRRARGASVLIVPLEHTFGWSRGTIIGGDLAHILLMGAVGPFVTARVQTLGLKRCQGSACSTWLITYCYLLGLRCGADDEHRQYYAQGRDNHGKVSELH